MPDQQKKFYLTTPIYYVNARPHIGHAYSTIAADVLARWRRLRGEDVFFLTGTDEHGQKVQRSAAAAGVPPQQFADRVSSTFRALWDRMGITYTDFIRTTEPRHKAGVQKLWQELADRGEIRIDSYTGAYCVSDEAFVDVTPGEPCPECGRATEEITEENYFFKLSGWQEALLELIENPDPEKRLHIQPESVRNEVLSFIRGGLKDLSISRTTFDWGIQVPGNDKHVVYVWLDALTNYITALGYGSDNDANFRRYWPADIHLVGKEITRFHCVYWPAFLMAARLPVPRSVVANGWLLFEESKMSKSRGNVVRTETILDAFGEHYRAAVVKGGQPEPDKRDCDLFAADVLRYFLLREIPFGQDGSFSFDALITRYNADLVNGYGNLVSRVLNLIQQNFDGSVPVSLSETEEWSYFGLTAPLIAEQFDKPLLTQAVVNISNLVSAADAVITKTAPWKLVKSTDPADREKAASVLRSAYEAVRIITALMYPILPHTTAKVWTQLGLGDIQLASENGKLRALKWGDVKPGSKLGPLAPIFPRAPKELADTMADMESRNAAKPAAPATSPLTDDVSEIHPPPEVSTHAAAPPQSTIAAEQAKPETPQISIDDFVKIDLRVAQIVVAERIPKADKLLRLEVDLGYERRQILSGIAQWYTPEELIGRRIAVIANLAPRKMRGLDSHGMLLAASDEGDAGSKPVLATFSDETPLGSRIR